MYEVINNDLLLFWVLSMEDREAKNTTTRDQEVPIGIIQVVRNQRSYIMKEVIFILSDKSIEWW